jgi:hypothetical protein
VVKQTWDERTSIYVASDNGVNVNTREVVAFRGPCARCVPFEDFFVYPLRANALDQVEIKFHRMRYSEEEAVRRAERGDWQLPEGIDITSLCRTPKDSRSLEQEADAGVSDSQYREFSVVECQLKYAVTNDGRDYDIFALLSEEAPHYLLDTYFNPYPDNLPIYADYRPFPREDLFYGESMCELLGQAQEEASSIHNDRRNNSMIANSVVFRRRNGATVPNPSTNWYPGKVFDLEDLQDLDVLQIGRNYSDMIPEEDYTFQLATKLSGIAEVEQGGSTGALAERGVYNTNGTIAMMQEGNQRQNTNIRDARVVLGLLANRASRLQSTLDPADPFIDTLPDNDADNVRAAILLLSGPRYAGISHRVKASDSGSNLEIEKANLFAISQVVGQYGQMINQAAMQLANQGLNPTIRQALIDTVTMHQWMVKRLLKAFGEYDAVEVIPDADKLFPNTSPAGAPPGGPPRMGPGGPANGLPPVPGPGMAPIPPMPGGPGGAPPMPGMGPR